MSNSEKISAYLENEMSAGEKQAFEEALTNNAELRREFNLQSDIVEGIKEARRLDLKAMLDNVPVGGTSVGGSLTFGKIASSLAVVGIVSLGIYYFTSSDSENQVIEQEQPTITAPEKPEVIQEDKETAEQPIAEEKEQSEATEAVEEQPKEQVSEEPAPAVEEKVEQPEEQVQQQSKEVEINKPTAAPMFETTETDSLEAPTNEIVDRVDTNISSLDVEIDNTKKKFSFHYQFNKGKLFLYGDFEESLYEIIEFKTSASKTLFLYYKDAFYPLDKQQVKITELKPVKEQSLIQKLEKVTDINQD